MLLILIGKTCSGKTTVVEELERNGFERVVTYTTREMRDGETPDVDYHFLTDEEFDKKVEDGSIDMGIRSYTMADGKKVRYGYGMNDATAQYFPKVIILTPDVVEEVKRKLGKNCKCCYLYANESTIGRRLEQRGDSREEAARRINADRKDFCDAVNVADFIIYNNGGLTLKEIVSHIKEKMS